MSRGFRVDAGALSIALAVSLLPYAPASGDVRKPPVNGRADYQFGGRYRPAKSASTALKRSTRHPSLRSQASWA